MGSLHPSGETQRTGECDRASDGLGQSYLRQKSPQGGNHYLKSGRNGLDDLARIRILWYNTGRLAHVNRVPIGLKNVTPLPYEEVAD